MGRHKKRHHSETVADDDSDEDSSASSGSESDSDSADGTGRRHSTSSHKKKKKKEKKRKKSKKSRRRSTDERISPEDYFLKNRELRLWLSEEKKVHFEDLTSEKSRDYFKQFVKQWNKGKLDKKYYQGITSGVRAQQDKTKHDWNISGVSKIQMGAVVSQVTSMTDDQEGFGPAVPAPAAAAAATAAAAASATSHPTVSSRPASVRNAPIKPLVGPMLPPGLQPQRDDPAEEREHHRQSVAQERRKRADFQREALDQMVPKPSGHEAKIAKRRAAAERHRARGDSPDMDYARVQRSGGDIERVIAARKKARERHMEVKQNTAAQKLRDYQERERDRMSEIMAMAKANPNKGALYQPK